MSSIEFTCWSCGKKTEIEDRVTRRSECPHCNADMHVCKNCEFFDLHAHNQCREPVAEYVAEKESSNFCDMFQAAKNPHQAAADVQSAKDKLEALFRK